MVGFGYMVSCIASSLPMALAIAPPILVPLMIFGGFFLNSRQVHKFQLLYSVQVVDC